MPRRAGTNSPIAFIPDRVPRVRIRRENGLDSWVSGDTAAIIGHVTNISVDNSGRDAYASFPTAAETTITFVVSARFNLPADLDFGRVRWMLIPIPGDAQQHVDEYLRNDQR